MLTPPEQFERDRAYFLFLLGQLRDWLRQASEEPPRLLPISGILRELDDLELPERCGLEPSPFAESGSANEDGWTATYEAHSPFDGATTETMWRAESGCGTTIPHELHARSKLAGWVELWIQTVQSIPVPSAYSCLSGSAVPGKSPVLARDRLWRQLHHGAWTYRRGGHASALDWADIPDAVFATYMRKVNALAKYDGLTTERIFQPNPLIVRRSTPTWLRILHPDDGTFVRINHNWGMPPSAGECERLGQAIALWKVARERQLIPEKTSSSSQTAESAAVRADQYSAGGLDPSLWNTESLKTLPPRERECLEEFLNACVSAGLPGNRATEAHWEGAGRPRAFPTWRKNVSEALRKILGPAKGRGDATARSIVSIVERPEQAP